MTIILNGRPREVDPGTTVDALILDVTGATRGSAAVLGGSVVPRSAWATTVLAEGAVVEIVTATQGG